MWQDLKAKLKEATNLGEGKYAYKEQRGVPLWKRLMLPVYMDNRAFLALIGIGVAIYLPVQYIVKPWGQKLRQQEKDRHDAVGKTFEDLESDHQKHVFKFKKEPTLVVKEP